MNIFKTAPKFIAGYLETVRFNRTVPEIEKLRAEGKLDEEKELIRVGQKRWIDNVSKKLDITYDIIGAENIPDKSPFMIYSNHQSFADIPAMLKLFTDKYPVSYVAKNEWRKYKVLYDAIKASRSIFLIRDNPRDAVRAVNEAKEMLDKGFILVIYPEGTRSKGHQMGEFKTASFKFAEKAKVPILPVTLDGGYKLFEEKGTYQPCHIKITVHPVVHIEEMDRKQQKQAALDIEATVRAALD